MTQDLKPFFTKADLTPDNSFAVPDDLIDKYGFLYKDKKNFIGKKFSAVLDLIKQVYTKGVEDGRK